MPCIVPIFQSQRRNSSHTHDRLGFGVNGSAEDKYDMIYIYTYTHILPHLVIVYYFFY